MSSGVGLDKNQEVLTAIPNSCMTEQLRKHVIARFGHEPENLDYVLGHFEQTKLKRGDHLLSPGEICKYVYYVVEGCVQVYVVDKAGSETTREFYVEDQWVTDIFGFQNQLPSGEFIRCVEPTTLLRIHFDQFQALSQQVPPFAFVYKQILELSYTNTVYRVNTLMSMDALDRIKWMMENKPKIMSRLSSKLLASYLGISPETMTRLKAKL
jgi:CRP-like cAMP-binding protein